MHLFCMCVCITDGQKLMLAVSEAVVIVFPGMGWDGVGWMRWEWDVHRSIGVVASLFFFFFFCCPAAWVLRIWIGVGGVAGGHGPIKCGPEVGGRGGI